jgi:hypothetical protein
LLLEVNYESQSPWPLAADGTGHSLVLARPSYGEADPRAWNSSDRIGGSPGGPDPFGADPLRSVVINEFLAHTDLPLEDFIELYNHSSQPWTFPARISAMIATRTNSASRTTPFSHRAVLFLSTKLSLASRCRPVGTHLLRQSEPATCHRHGGLRSTSERRFQRTLSRRRAWFPRIGGSHPGTTNAALLVREVVINELMFNPISGSDNDEYVELYNRSTNAVDLSGWRFTAGIDYQFPRIPVFLPMDTSSSPGTALTFSANTRSSTARTR